MKKLKKLLALALAIAMIAGAMTGPAFAAGKGANLSSGAKLELIGMLKGDGGGVTDTYLAKRSTRMQLAILSARWLGFEQEAYDFTRWNTGANFVDHNDGTSKAEWNMLAYYFADESLGFIGIGAGYFKPQDNITNKELAKILLVAMGYPYGVKYNWDNILQFAAGIGIGLGSRETGITNGGMADAIVNALESLSNYSDGAGGKLTFAQYLLGLGVVAEDDLIEAGIAYKEAEEEPAPPPEEVELPTLSVTSAAADNFAEVELTFNQRVDPNSTVGAAVKIDGANASSGAKVYVADDASGKIVRIYEPSRFVGAQNETRTISLSGLKTPNGITMSAFSQQITFRDTSAPAIEKVVAKGNTRLDIHFTEPLEAGSAIRTLANYQADDRAISASEPALNDDAVVNTARVVTIKNIKTTLSAGTHTLGVLGSNIKDYAGNTMGYKTADFEITSKTDGPVALRVLDPVFQYKVMIEFDDVIQDDAYIRWVDGSKSNNSDKTTVNGNIATFEFTSASKAIPYNGATITIIGARDYWGNPARQNLSFDVVPAADTQRPAVTGYGTEAGGAIWIKFNKRIDAATAKNPSNYVIKNADGNQTYDWNYEFDAAKDDAKVTLKSKGGDSAKTGRYKITLKNIKDTVLPNANTILEVTIEVDVPDTDAPVVISATWGWAEGIPESSRRIINIFFDEELDYLTAVTRANYRTRIPGESYKDLPNNAQVTLQPGNRTVTLTFPAGFPAGNIDVSVSNIQDLYGNRTNDVKQVTNKLLASVASVKATGARKIEMTFSAEISSFDPANVRITDSTGAAVSQLAVDSATYSNSDKKVTITLNRDLSKDAKFNGNSIYVYEQIPDIGKPASPNLPVYAVQDGIAPAVSTDSYFKKSDYYSMADEFSIFLIFDEKIQPHASAAEWSVVFPDIRIGDEIFINGKRDKDDGYKVEWKIHPLQQISSTGEWYLQIEFISNASGTPKLKGSDISFTYMAYPERTIQDAAGNDIGSDGFKDIRFTSVRFGY